MRVLTVYLQKSLLKSNKPGMGDYEVIKVKGGRLRQ